MLNLKTLMLIFRLRIYRTSETGKLMLFTIFQKYLGTLIKLLQITITHLSK